jgi:hypothetical protein
MMTMEEIFDCLLFGVTMVVVLYGFFLIQDWLVKRFFNENDSGGE